MRRGRPRRPLHTARRNGEKYGEEKDKGDRGRGGACPEGLEERAAPHRRHNGEDRALDRKGLGPSHGDGDKGLCKADARQVLLKERLKSEVRGKENMGKSLVIVESPAKANTINKF